MTDNPTPAIDSKEKPKEKAKPPAPNAAFLMTDWQEKYKSKVRTAEQAIATIRRGDKVFIGSGAAEPQVLVKALIDSAGRLAGNRIMHNMTQIGREHGLKPAPPTTNSGVWSKNVHPASVFDVPASGPLQDRLHEFQLPPDPHERLLFVGYGKLWVLHHEPVEYLGRGQLMHLG